MLVMMILIGVYFDVDIFMMISMLILMFEFLSLHVAVHEINSYV